VKRLGATLVFIDESGILMAPLVTRTWAPRGNTPHLYQRTASYRKVSAIAAVTISPKRRFSLYFRLHINANIDSGLARAFLKALLKEIPGKIVLVWDNLRVHRSRLVKEFCRAGKRISLEYFPPYAPELDPVEYVWSYLKKNPLANHPAHDLAELASTARRSGRSVQKREPLLRSFMKHTGLSFRMK
jgi:transposase